MSVMFITESFYLTLGFKCKLLFVIRVNFYFIIFRNVLRYSIYLHSIKQNIIVSNPWPPLF